MASLTRAEYVEMWGTVKMMEASVQDLRALLHYLPPYRRQQLSEHIREYDRNIQFIKQQIQSVIGQME